MHHRFREKAKGHLDNPVLEIVADINGVLGGFALYPQVIHVFKTHDIQGLSMLTFLIIAINSSIWLFYAMRKRITPLRISSALNVTASVTILLFVVFLG